MHIINIENYKNKEEYGNIFSNLYYLWMWWGKNEENDEENNEENSEENYDEMTIMII